MVDSELLISEVEKQAILWDTSLEEYKDKNKKNAAWVAVASSLFETFVNKTEAEQKILVQDLEKKWRSIRDNFIRNRKKTVEANRSGSGAAKIKKYVYEEHLRFPQNAMEMLPTHSSIADNSEQDNNSSTIDNDNSGIENDTDEVSVEQHSTTAKQRRTVNTANRVRKNCYIEDKLVSFMEAHQPKQDLCYEDEDLAFFKSLLPTVRKLDSDQKFTFRMQTLHLLHNLQKATSTVQNVSFNSGQQSSSMHGVATNKGSVYSDEAVSRPSSTATFFSNFSPVQYSTDESQFGENPFSPQYLNM